MMSIRLSLLAGVIALGASAAHAAGERPEARPQGELRVGDTVPQRMSVWFPQGEPGRGGRGGGSFGVVIVGDTVLVVDEQRRVVEVKR